MLTRLGQRGYVVREDQTEYRVDGVDTDTDTDADPDGKVKTEPANNEILIGVAVGIGIGIEKEFTSHSDMNSWIGTTLMTFRAASMSKHAEHSRAEPFAMSRNRHRSFSSPTQATNWIDTWYTSSFS